MTATTQLRRRHDLYDECHRLLTPTSTDELMTSLSPPGWSWDDIATKADLATQGRELRAEMAVGFADVRKEMAEGFRRQQSWMVATTLSIAGLALTTIALAIAALVR
jgi:glutamate-1-semialdehyde aminotransferase